MRLGTHVFNIGLRHPFTTARGVQTVDLLSGGRFDFGIGASWLEQEWDAAQVYQASDALMGKMRAYPGFASVSSDAFRRTPRLEIDFLREQAKAYGVSESRILALNTGEVSDPYRSDLGYHIFRLESKDALEGDGLTRARQQIREILFRQKYEARLDAWLREIRERAIIEVRM